VVAVARRALGAAHQQVAELHLQDLPRLHVHNPIRYASCFMPRRAAEALLPPLYPLSEVGNMFFIMLWERFANYFYDRPPA
jgi:hypothetical protein